MDTVRYWARDGLDVFLAYAPVQPAGNPSTLAYHITVDSNDIAIPINASGIQNVKVAVTQKRNLSTWEISLKIPSANREAEKPLLPEALYAGKILGFSIAYNDTDKGQERESRMGNIPVEPGPGITQGGSDPGMYKQLRL